MRDLIVILGCDGVRAIRLNPCTKQLVLMLDGVHGNCFMVVKSAGQVLFTPS